MKPETTLRCLIEGMASELMDVPVSGVVIVLATEGAPTVTASCPPDQAKELLETSLQGDWNARKQIN